MHERTDDLMSLASSISEADLAAYWTRQVQSFFYDGAENSPELALQITRDAMERVNDCFSVNLKKYFSTNGQARFNHLHSDQYAMFLYIASNVAYRVHNSSVIAEKLYLLNKALHGLDALYSIALPAHFSFTHPLGTVLGRASYGDYFAVYQGCTVGSTGLDSYPSFGEGVLMYANSSVIGACTIGDDVVVGAGALVVSTDIPSGSLVVGRGPDLRILKNRLPAKSRAFLPNI